MQDINKVIDMLPEEKHDEVLRRAESRPKRENVGARLYRLVMYFDRKTYKSGFFYEGKKPKISDRIIHEIRN